MLETLARPLRDLEELIAAIGARQVCRELNIHDKTLYRWRTRRSTMPGRQHITVKMLLGDLPGTAGQWTGWKFVAGKLVSPTGDQFQPGEILAIGLNHQRIAALEQEVIALRVKLEVA